MADRKIADQHRTARSPRPSYRWCLGLVLIAALAGAPEGAIAQANLDLSIRTQVVSPSCLPGDSCTFAVAITNFGPDTFSGTLRLRGAFRQNIRPGLASIGPAGWSCNQRSGTTVCSHETTSLRPGRSLLLETTYDLPSAIASYDLTYCAELQWDALSYQGGEPSVADVQRALAARGYDPGPIDGVPGFATRDAIIRFQMDNRMEPTGFPTREFFQRLFSGRRGLSGDTTSGNDSDCASTSELPPPPDNPDTLREPQDTSPEAPEEQSLPTIRKPLPSGHRKSLSTFHETYRSGLHDKVISEPRDGDPEETESRPQSERQPSVGAQHGKLISDFHRKQKSDQHDKVTSGAVVETRPLGPVGDTDQSDEDGSDWKKAFHQKYKSVQHDKETTEVQKIHTKSISQVVHSKARSAITNPQFQGNAHDKVLSGYHKKFLSSSHDPATSRARADQ